MQESNMGRVPNAGPETGPLNPPDAPQGAPTTYVPPQPTPYTQSNQSYSTPQGAGIPRVPNPYNRAGQARREGHRIPILGPLLLIIIGTIFLLNNLNIVDWSVWESLSRLWPLVLIAVGVDQIFGRRRPALTLLLVLAIFAAGGGYLYSSGGVRSSGKALTMNLLEPLGNAKSADVTLKMGTGDLSLAGDMQETTNLASGILHYMEGGGQPSIQRSATGDVANLRLEQGHSFSLIHIFGNDNLRWDLHFNPRVPLRLAIETGAGNATLDLSRFQLSGFSLHAGAGDASVTFPGTGIQGSSTIDTGAGDLSIIVPEGLKARIKISHNVGDVSADSRFSKGEKDVYITKDYSAAGNHLDLAVNAGVGDVVIRPASRQP
ncbi:MAG: toast rack family protein [Chloroflexota bacterium]|nr:toast rack family protein [Chloroflexota bacterium]